MIALSSLGSCGDHDRFRTCLAKRYRIPVVLALKDGLGRHAVTRTCGITKRYSYS